MVNTRIVVVFGGELVTGMRHKEGFWDVGSICGHGVYLI